MHKHITLHNLISRAIHHHLNYNLSVEANYYIHPNLKEKGINLQPLNREVSNNLLTKFKTTTMSLIVTTEI